MKWNRNVRQKMPRQDERRGDRKKGYRLGWKGKGRERKLGKENREKNGEKKNTMKK